MSSVKDTVRHALFNYPLLFPSPLHVVVNLFTSSGGWHWNRQGELVNYYEHLNADSMKYSDLDEHLEYCKDYENFPIIKLETEARRMMRKFIEDNIEVILEGDLLEDYFGTNTYNTSYYTKHINLDSQAFHFPDNITKEWGTLLYKFFENWLVTLNYTYGVSQTHDDVSFWPENMQKARIAILDAKARLHPLIHNGEIYEHYVERMRKLSNSLMKDILKKEE